MSIISEFIALVHSPQTSTVPPKGRNYNSNFKMIYQMTPQYKVKHA